MLVLQKNLYSAQIEHSSKSIPFEFYCITSNIQLAYMYEQTVNVVFILCIQKQHIIVKLVFYGRTNAYWNMIVSDKNALKSCSSSNLWVMSINSPEKISGQLNIGDGAMQTLLLFKFFGHHYSFFRQMYSMFAFDCDFLLAACYKNMEQLCHLSTLLLHSGNYISMSVLVRDFLFILQINF